VVAWDGGCYAEALPIALHLLQAQTGQVILENIDLCWYNPRLIKQL
jgi:hypothetical protein